MRMLYKIKGEPLGIQFYILVRATFVIIGCIYVINRIIKLITRRKATLTEPSFRDTALSMAVYIPEVSPANRKNVIININ